MKTAYPFIKHIPVVIVMSMSYFSNCAGMCLAGKATRFHLTEPVPYNSAFYLREFTDVNKLEAAQIPDMFKNYYSK